MTWWRRLLGLNPIESRQATPTPADTGAGPKRVTIEKHGGRIVSVRELDFTGQCATSPNGRFTLLWRDRAIVNDSYRGGRYLLIDNGRVVLDEEMARPQDGKVTVSLLSPLLWIDDDTVTETRRGGLGCRIDAILAHEVQDGRSLEQQIVGDDPSVTSPPDRFRAHDSAWRLTA